MTTNTNSTAQQTDASARRQWFAEWLNPLVAIALTAWFVSFVPAVARGETFAASWSWVPSLNVRLSFNLDGLGLLFALLISSIGALVFIFARGYMGDHPDRARIYFWLLACS